jgi:hypothetical protein
VHPYITGLLGADHLTQLRREAEVARWAGLPPIALGSKSRE